MKTKRICGGKEVVHEKKERKVKKEKKLTLLLVWEVIQNRKGKSEEKRSALLRARWVGYQEEVVLLKAIFCCGVKGRMWSHL
ncbi:MAG: hypothetical protein ACFN4U_01385 [Candidatus Absconditicoccaceae bacterium]